MSLWAKPWAVSYRRTGHQAPAIRVSYCTTNLTILPSSSATICLDLSSEPSQRMKVFSFIEDPFTSTRHRNRTRAAAFADLDARRHGGGYFFPVGDDTDHAPCFTAQLLQRLG